MNWFIGIMLVGIYCAISGTCWAMTGDKLEDRSTALRFFYWPFAVGLLALAIVIFGAGVGDWLEKIAEKRNKQ